MLRYFLFVLFVLLGSSVFGQNCSNDEPFSSFSEALDYVENTDFECALSYDASNESSWVGEIKWYSCDCSDGYLVVELQGREYVHRDVPKETFEDFTQAPSKGRFYDAYIRGRFRL